MVKDMEECLVSVVLPIYKVEKYLDRCIESIVKQTYKSLEIILVDDGSPDHCPQMCDEWKSRDSRIKVIHKENAGLGMARNTGIENAKGEFICFFDSDDYIALDTIEKTVGLARKYNAEIVTFGFSSVDYNGKVIQSCIPETIKEVFSGKEVESTYLPDMIAEVKTSKNKGLHMSAWASIYSMGLIRRCNWKFVSERDIIAEDVYSLLVLYKFVKCVAVVHEALYFYCDNETSLTHTYRKDRYQKIKKFYIESKKKAVDLEYSDNIIDRICVPYFSFTIAAMKQIVTSNTNLLDKFKEIHKIVCDELLQEILLGMNIKMQGRSKQVLIQIMKNRWSVITFGMIMVACIKKG